jgi:dsDNA-binding SOS-regulon protein
MSYATYVDGEFKLLMCCDSDNYNDDIAFPMYYDLINKQKEFYPFSMGGGINSDNHETKNGEIYSSARIEFAKFLKKQNIALFASESKRKKIQSEYELLYQGCKKPNLNTIKSLDYFFMLYNGDFVRNEIDQNANENREKLEDKLSKLIENYNNIFQTYNTEIGPDKEDKKYLDLYSKIQVNEEYEEAQIRNRDKQLITILRHFQQYSKIIDLADKISEKVDSILNGEQRVESEMFLALNQIKGCIQRGQILIKPGVCQKESVSDYEKKLTEIESNFDNIVDKLIKKL